MKQELKENQGLPASLLWTLAIIAGISVANLYYNQPLLNRISRDLQTSEFTANLIAMITQIGYAIGLLFIIPLGDLFKRKTIILINFTVLVVSLLTIALTPYIHLILFASLLTGICSVMPTNLYPHSCTILHPQNQRKKCRHDCTSGLTDWYFGFARSQRNRRRIFGMAVYFLCSGGNDGDMSHHYHACTTRYAM